MEPTQFEVLMLAITGLRSEIKSEISGLRGEVSGIKGEVSGLKGEFRRLETKLDEGFAGVNTRLGRIEIKLDTTFVQVAKITERVSSLEEGPSA